MTSCLATDPAIAHDTTVQLLKLSLCDTSLCDIGLAAHTVRVDQNHSN